MQITLIQSEIQEAVKMYLTAKFTKNLNQSNPEFLLDKTEIDEGLTASVFIGTLESENTNDQ